MTNQIDVDDEVFGVLKAKAEPFVDTPNSVLRRLLGIEPAGPHAATVATRSAASAVAPTATNRSATKKVMSKTKGSARTAPKRTRAARGTLLPEDRYETPLLRALVDAGGQAPYRDILDSVGCELKDDLLPADFETLDSGTIRWQSRLQFVRLRLKERGYLAKDTPRGIWGITDAGRAAIDGSAT